MTTDPRSAPGRIRNVPGSILVGGPDPLRTSLEKRFWERAARRDPDSGPWSGGSTRHGGSTIGPNGPLCRPLWHGHDRESRRDDGFADGDTGRTRIRMGAHGPVAQE